MTQEANTIWTEAYTPSGFQVGITIAFDSGKLPQAVDVETMITGAGYLLNAPGLEAGETLETITHVIRRTQHNQDGTQTPCIGLYYENPKLEFAKKAYLNTPEEIETFERLSGLRIADLPEFPSTALPKRSEKSAQTYIKQAKTPFQIRMVDDTYTDTETGEVKPTKKYAGFYAPQTSAPDNLSKPDFKADGGQSETSEGAFKRELIAATKFMYEPDYVENRHFNSLKKHIESGKVKIGMDMDKAVLEIMKHRAFTDMFLDSGDYQKIFGMAIETYAQGQGLQKTWERFVEYFQSVSTSATTKNAS